MDPVNNPANAITVLMTTVVCDSGLARPMISDCTGTFCKILHPELNSQQISENVLSVFCRLHGYAMSASHVQLCRLLPRDQT